MHLLSSQLEYEAIYIYLFIFTNSPCAYSYTWVGTHIYTILDAQVRVTAVSFAGETCKTIGWKNWEVENWLQSKVFRNTLGLTLFNDKSLPLSRGEDWQRFYVSSKNVCYKIRFTFYLVRIFPRYRSLKCERVERDESKTRKTLGSLLRKNRKIPNKKIVFRLYTFYGDCAFVLLPRCNIVCERTGNLWRWWRGLHIRLEKMCSVCAKRKTYYRV